MVPTDLFDYLEWQSRPRGSPVGAKVALGMLLGSSAPEKSDRFGWRMWTWVCGGVRVVGKSGRERVVPIDRPFFSEVAAYLRSERPEGLSTAECFVVLRGGQAGASR